MRVVSGALLGRPVTLDVRVEIVAVLAVGRRTFSVVARRRRTRAGTDAAPTRYRYRHQCDYEYVL